MLACKPVLKYTLEQTDEICGIIASGRTLAHACREVGLPHTTFRHWVDNDYDGLAAKYKKARETCVDQMVDEIIDIADDARFDTKTDAKGKRIVDVEVIARSKLRIEARKFIAAVVSPNKYSEKIDITNHHTLLTVSEDPVKVEEAKVEWLSEHTEFNGKGH